MIELKTNEFCSAFHTFSVLNKVVNLLDSGHLKNAHTRPTNEVACMKLNAFGTQKIYAICEKITNFNQ